MWRNIFAFMPPDCTCVKNNKYKLQSLTSFERFIYLHFDIYIRRYECKLMLIKDNILLQNIIKNPLLFASHKKSNKELT